MLAYPALFSPDDPPGSFTATFRDVPEAITCGFSAAETLEMAADVLSFALSDYIEGGRPIPPPSARQAGETMVALPAEAAAKIGLYEAMRALGMNPAGLASRLGASEADVLSLLDTGSPARLDDIERALAALGKRLDIRVSDAA